ncbi:T9SS type A sorting domain-containing protein [Taibaiella koreensis]|uniref:T9SS type A sorting domain-containing protein n=1 Tax=Taibaiella koreensis TaxID=1268548 RepID=UPI000E59F892|nr:T9SS type A sorting domain-containing protein [Taibaiella koreensis]
MKRLLIFTVFTAIAASAQAQNTTYGGGNAPYVLDGGYNSDYSPGGTVVLADGSVSLSNNATYEHGNTLLQNSGGWTSSNSLDLFLAAGSNTISGTVAPLFFNTQFNIGAGNTMAITNTQGINIAGNLQFSNGITTTVRSSAQTGALHFAAGATYTNGTTDAQHVDGYVSKSGTTAFIFPVGSATDIRTLAITAPAAIAEISTAWFTGNPGTVTDPSDGSTHSITTVAAPLVSVSEAGFWDWVPVSGSDDGIAVTVSIPDIGGFASASDLRLAGWNGSQWIDLSGNATATGNTEGSILSGTIPVGGNITAIAIGSLSTPLPVQFSAFAVKAEGCAVRIAWSTAMEQNNDYFQVERSADGRLFKEIARVAGAVNSHETREYTANDAHPLKGLGYYRVQQVDRDGKRSSTAVQSAYTSCNGDGEIKVFPTATKDVVQVLLPAGYESAVVDLVNTLGQKMAVPIEGGNLSYRIHVDQLASAMYLIRVRKGTALHCYKVIREN